MKEETLRLLIKMRFRWLIFGLLLCLLIIDVSNSVMIDRNTNFRDQMVLTAEYCCEGYFCTDTYYDVDTGVCVLTLSGDTYKTNKTPLVSVIK